MLIIGINMLIIGIFLSLFNQHLIIQLIIISIYGQFEKPKKARILSVEVRKEESLDGPQ